MTLRFICHRSETLENLSFIKNHNLFGIGWKYFFAPHKRHQNIQSVKTGTKSLTLELSQTHTKDAYVVTNSRLPFGLGHVLLTFPKPFLFPDWRIWTWTSLTR